MVAQAQPQPRPRFRDHAPFWLGFTALLLTGLLLVIVAYLALGSSAAGGTLLIEVSAALAAGMR